MAKRSVTSYDVAKRAGVSQSAVSRAFSPGRPIARNTRERVLKAAQELGYQPNAIARSMSAARSDPHQKSGMVGVIVTRLQDPFFSQSIADLSHGLQSFGWQMLLFTVESQSEVDGALSTLMQYKVDGMLILSAILSDKMAESCRKRGIPVMLFNRSADGRDVSSVQIENQEGGRLAAEFLLELGHQRIAFVAGEAGDATSTAREEGFRERLVELGHTLFLREEGNYTFESGREAGLRLFSRNERPDAVFCASDVMALGTLHSARYEMGLDVPKDFSLIGFDDIPAAGWPGHALTTIRQPIRRMIREAVEVLVEHMKNPDMPARSVLFSGKLILRQSCLKRIA
ncbi:LacI family DNA-binding transcriptional regulator [Hoeflea sp. TYP-13]|uniref:LacI family DNA-binding transcriptional regulator n=1 Tax=Hoeflea sp. TYP-13 TaxID=3230023 RepID=UPI0034C6202B